MITEIRNSKYVESKNFTSGVPNNKSESKNNIIASQKKEKYSIAHKANIIDSQKGIKRIEISSTNAAEILNSIFLSYLEASADASPM